MSIFLRTGDPQALAARFNGLIAAREISAWTVDRFGNYFHDVPHWHYAAFFNPVILGDGLRLNLHFIDKSCDRRFCFAELHGAMLQALLQHCGDRFHDAHVSRGPDYGDEPFEG